LTSRKYKIGLIRCLADRIWKICSETDEKETELRKLKVILAKNDYPTEVVEKAIASFRASKEGPAVPPKEEKPEKRFLKLPYVNRACDEFASRYKKLVESNFEQVEFNVAFQAPMTIGKLFPFKDRIANTTDRSMVVYNIKCLNCEAEYIGETTRILRRRIAEHRANTASNKSACKEHEVLTGHKMNYDGALILDSADTDKKLEVKEALHILKKKPSLNKQLNSQSDFALKLLTIKAIHQPKATS
jgi:predicted GIY-YIG superfamily endonuclease